MSVDRNRVSWTSDELLTEVRRKASIPSGSLKWTDAVLLREASDVLRSFAGWAMTKAGDGRQLYQLERTSMITTAYGESREILLPPHAVADTIDGVFWLDNAGNEVRLSPIDLNSQPVFDSPSATGNPSGYAVMNGTIRIYPEPSSANTFRINYARRHPELILTSDASATVVQSVTGDDSSTTFTLGDDPYTTGEALDLINSYSPYRVYLADMVITAKPGLFQMKVGVPYSQVSGFAPTGSVLVPSGTSPYVHLPQELRACVTFKVAAHVMSMIGDDIGAQSAESTAASELQRAIDLMNPRVKSQRQKIVNQYSLMRAGRYGRGWH